MTLYGTSYRDPPWILSFDHAELLSWWQFKRFFNRAGASVVCKPFADIVVVHPAPRFTTAENRQQWEEACRWALLAYCNHGATSKDTFDDKVQLEGLSTEEQQELMDKFIFTAPDNRQQQRLTQCPPHIRKKILARPCAFGAHGATHTYSRYGYCFHVRYQVCVHGRRDLTDDTVRRHDSRGPKLGKVGVGGGG